MVNKKINFKTDMADERVDEYKKINNLTEIDGIKITVDEKMNFAKVVTVEIINEEAAKLIDKEIGKYITIECNEINYLNEEQKDILKQKIKEILLDLMPDKEAKVMVVGLGNLNITPDALGSKVTSKLNITRHLFKFAKELTTNNMREISSISPGVLGTTGIETAEIVESIKNKIKPDLIIAIDSLMSQSMHRLGKTIQISNKGIIPGSGTENMRIGINEKELKVPVISIGIPLVMETITIISEAIKNDEKIIESDVPDMIVVPKDIDALVEIGSTILADSINIL